MNKVDFGLVKADLLANYDKPQRDRINVAFEWIRFMLGPLSFQKVRHMASLSVSCEQLAYLIASQ